MEISVSMHIDANGLLEVEAEESRSGAKANIKVDPKNCKDLFLKIKIFLLIKIPYRST